MEYYISHKWILRLLDLISMLISRFSHFKSKRTLCKQRRFQRWLPIPQSWRYPNIIVNKLSRRHDQINLYQILILMIILCHLPSRKFPSQPAGRMYYSSLRFIMTLEKSWKQTNRYKKFEAAHLPMMQRNQARDSLSCNQIQNFHPNLWVLSHLCNKSLEKL